MMAVVYTLIVMILPTNSIGIPIAIMLAREIGVSAIREFMASLNMRDEVKVGTIGKWKTASQMVSSTLLLLSFSFEEQSTPIHAIAFIFGRFGLYLSTLLSLVSGWKYYKAAEPYLKRGAKDPK